MLFKEFIIEGKYDSLTRRAVKDIMKQVKASKRTYDSDLKAKNTKTDKYHTVDMGNYIGALDFDLILNIKRSALEKNIGFALEASARTETYRYGDGVADIDIYLNINPESEPKIYNKIVSHLIDTMRHEIEHLTQSGLNKKKGKPRKSIKIRNKINSGELPTYRYFILKDEIPAMVRGMHKQSKHEKKPLDFILTRYLDYQKKQGLISSKEINKIMKIWMKYAKKELPNAKYSNKAEKWLN